MKKSERETLIIINAADLDEGYFTFGTSEPSQFRRLCNRVGGRHLLHKVREEKDDTGKVRWWECYVPVRFFSPRTFGIGKKANRNIRKAVDSRKAKKTSLLIKN